MGEVRLRRAHAQPLERLRARVDEIVGEWQGWLPGLSIAWTSERRVELTGIGFSGYVELGPDAVEAYAAKSWLVPVPSDRQVEAELAKVLDRALAS
jgi:hypothetical protein